MKKLISLALCFSLALVFAAGCKKKEEAPAPAAENSEAEFMVEFEALDRELWAAGFRLLAEDGARAGPA